MFFPLSPVELLAKAASERAHTHTHTQPTQRAVRTPARQHTGASTAVTFG